MSNLKHLSVWELEKEKLDCEKYINNMKSKLNGQNVRLEWIDRYIFEKTPQELTIGQIEQRLGHRVIIKRG